MHLGEATIGTATPGSAVRLPEARGVEKTTAELIRELLEKQRPEAGLCRRALREDLLYLGATSTNLDTGNQANNEHEGKDDNGKGPSERMVMPSFSGNVEETTLEAPPVHNKAGAGLAADD